MRAFLSAFSDFTLAVPMDAVTSIMLYKQGAEKTVQHDQENRNIYISLPHLFNLPGEAVCHAINLRAEDTTAHKIVLLTAEVKRDIDIPDEQFFPIPKALNALRFSKVFSGIQLAGDPVLLLNVEQLVQSVQKEQIT
jgi:hypothetical protein